MSIRKDICEIKRKIQAEAKELNRMKQCLNEAGVDDEGMSLEEIKLTYRAINCSRDISLTVDSDESDNENAVSPQPSASVGVNKSTEFGGMPWLSKAKSAAQASESVFKYKIPKAKRASKNAPLESTNDQNCVKESATIRRCSPSTSSNHARSVSPTQPPSVLSNKNQLDNPFAALDDGDPRDLPILKIRPLERSPKNIYPEIVGLHVPPPYNDPRVAALPYKERYAIIGKYMKDMQDMIFRLSRASPRKAVWGKPIVSSNRFKGTIDKVSTRVVYETSNDEMEIEMEPFEENSTEENECTKSPVTSEFFVKNPFQDVIENEPSNVDTDEVRTNLKTQRKRKATKDHIDSLSDSDSTDNDDPDYEEVKRKKTSSASASFDSSSDLRFSTASNIVDRSPSISRTYTELMDNRPEITLISVRGTGGRGKGKGRGGKGVGKSMSNTDIMARSSLFKESAIIKAAGNSKSNSRVLSRNHRLVNLCQAEEVRKDVATQNRVQLEHSLIAEEIDEDNSTTRIIDDDGDFVNPDVNLKRKRVPVPLPKCRPGVHRLPRKNPPHLESKVNSSDGDVIELYNPSSIKIEEDEELPCPMCNVMFKSSIIQDHAENCEGPDSINIRTITCGKCDQVFLLNKDFEVHSLKCIRASIDK